MSSFTKLQLSPYFEDFRILHHKNKKHLLEVKESLSIMRDRPSMNQNIRFVPLYLFEWIYVTLFVVTCVLLFLVVLLNLLDLSINYKFWFTLCRTAWQWTFVVCSKRAVNNFGKKYICRKNLVVVILYWIVVMAESKFLNQFMIFLVLDLRHLSQVLIF